MGKAQDKARVHLYTGEGEGKTTTSLGLALRAIGHNKKVIIIQFMKGWKNIGEYKIRNKLKPLYEIHQFGRKEWVNLTNPEKVDIDLAKKGLDFAKQCLKKKPFLLILEEINLAVNVGLLNVNDVLDVIKKVPKETTVVLTGRRAHKKLIQRADLVTEMRMVKHPFKKGVRAKPGLEFVL